MPEVTTGDFRDLSAFIRDYEPRHNYLAKAGPAALMTLRANTPPPPPFPTPSGALGSLLGMAITEDPHLPDDVIEIRDRDGNLIRRFQL